MLEAIELRKKIFALLDVGKYEETLKILNTESSLLFDKKERSPYVLAELAGSYITLGSESLNIAAIHKGIELFIANKEFLKGSISEGSINYCLGNGYHSLYKINSQKAVNYFPKPNTVKEFLFEAKQCYIKSYKQIDLLNLNDYSIQVLTNLGNNLSQSGRIVEALQLFDIVLKYNPEFPQALVSKADGLDYMTGITQCPITISLISQMYALYKSASQHPIALEVVSDKVKLGLRRCEGFLKSRNFDFSKLRQEIKLNEIEYNNHSPEIKYYLDNFLCISEHSLYCKCNGAKIDDLMIGYPGFITSDKKIVSLEMLLNRIKSEFSLARNLFFDFLSNEKEDNFHYENLGSDLINGLRFEKLRTSFRLCFGILDKIAEGVFFLFELNKGKRESIYFDSFWNNQNAPKGRWERINSVNNIHLTALYSIACDLNSRNGEFGFYKTWRNRLEHGVFSLTKNNNSGLNLLNDNLFSEFTNCSDFEEKTKHLLQMTRSAIFSYVYLARQELIN